jgi:DNA-binding transcriptional LysR family regulator
MFDPELLKSFVAVAENGGFTKAAHALKSTQSTVSAQIQRLEIEAGRPLFLRSTRAVQLTSAGETMLGFAKTILRLNEDARLRLAGARPAGRLRIGASEDLTDRWLPDVLGSFSRRYPQVQIELEIGIGPSLFRAIETQELDVVIAGICNEPVQGRSLWKEPLVWVYAEDARISDEMPLAFFPEPCPYREAALRVLAASQRQWHIVCTSSSLAGVRAAAMAGLAVTPLPKQAVRPGLRILRAREHLPVLPEVEYVLRTRETETRPAIEAFANYCQQSQSAVRSPSRGRGRGKRE